MTTGKLKRQAEASQMRESSINKFLRSEGGSVSVDWVVLTAAVAGMALAATAVIEEGIGTLASDLEEIRISQVVGCYVEQKQFR